MRRVRLPVNPEAERRADRALLAETGGRAIDPHSEADAALRERWLDQYALAGGELESSDESTRDVTSPIQSCPRKQIELRYLRPDGTPVAGATYVVESYSGEVWYTGKLDANGYVKIEDVPYDRSSFYYYFLDDPGTAEINRVPSETPEAPPAESVLDSILQWIWGTVQGDFNENQSPSQIAANAILGLIPVVDQIMDVRDIIAGVKSIVEYYGMEQEQREGLEGFLGLSYEAWLWLNLFIIVIGCIPEVGSLVKGVLRGLIRFLLDNVDRAGNLSADKLRILWGYLISIFNAFGTGNAHTWLKQLPDKLDGWMTQASTRLKSCLDIIQGMLLKGKEIVESWVGYWALEAEQRNSFLAAVQWSLRSLGDTYNRLDSMKELVNRWIREQITRVLQGKHDFRQPGTAGTLPAPEVNVRTQEVAEPPRSLPEAASLRRRETLLGENEGFLSDGRAMPAGTRRVEYGDGEAVYYLDPKGRIIRAEGVLNPSEEYTKAGVSHLSRPEGHLHGIDHRGHLIPERGASNAAYVNVPENVISEHGRLSNLSAKKAWENSAIDFARENPGVRSIHEPLYHGDEMRPYAVRHDLRYPDGKRVPNFRQLIPNPTTNMRGR